MLLKSALSLTLVASLINAAVIIPNIHKRGEGASGKFVHVTDFHFDPHYVEGASVSSFCHRKDGENDKGIAGKFGTLGSKCDAPKALIDATFEFLKEQASDADFVIYTGDSVRHDRDLFEMRSDEEVKSTQELLVKYFTSTFSKVIPVLGNNDVETHNNIMAYDDQYLEFMSTWAPFNLNLGQDFIRGGYYVQELAPNLRTINTNTMDFFKKNELLYTDCDVPGPGRNQLDWLRKSLEDTRASKSKAYILAHVPPNSKKDKHFYKDRCYNEYYSLLGSYSDVILAHFSGHFNYDQLTAVLQNKQDGTYTRVAALGEEEVPMTAEELEIYKVVGVLFNAPSIVPQQNPAVRIYTYDTEGTQYPYGTILDWDQYYANLEEANQSGTLKYKLEYTASKLYNVDRFDASGLQSVFEAISLDETVRQQYTAFRAVNVDKAAEI
ncbi:Metallo-dependent phosphatase-like protein [Parasitella parasitica]|nr:Metallo-dependent phosphatase-like protein [Parasitella parasitica]